MKLNSKEIDFAAALIGKIDSGERNLFLENINTEQQVSVRCFSTDGTSGIFFSYRYGDRLRIAIAFEDDTEQFNQALATLIKSAIDTAGPIPVMIWLRNENHRIIDFVKRTFAVSPEVYASAEYIMRRDCFNREYRSPTLSINPYAEQHIDTYLRLLDQAMTFEIPAPAYQKAKNHFIKQFAHYRDENAFEAFWLGDELVGLYWRKGGEIDHIAVSPAHQRRGYGSAILTRAIAMVFDQTDAPFAYLYAVDWNDKGQAFYHKYGMELNGHSCLLRI